MIDTAKIRALIFLAQTAAEDEARYVRPDGTPTYDDERSVRMIVRDKSLVQCGPMLEALLKVYEAACVAREAHAALDAAKRAPRRSGSAIERQDAIIRAEDAWLDAVEVCDAAVDAARSQ